MFLNTEGFDEEVNIGATDRDFQQSIVIKQDENKSGILSFLKEIEEETSPRPQRNLPPTTRPTRPGGY